MGSIMLITNAVLLISSVCSSTSIATSTGTFVARFDRSKRGVVYSNPAWIHPNSRDPIGGAQTTARVSPSRSVDINSRPPAQSHRSVKASDGTRSKAFYMNPNHPTGNSGSLPYSSGPPLPYGSSSGQQIESQTLKTRSLAPYSDTSSNPHAYRVSTVVGEPLDASKLIVSPSLSNLLNVYAPIYDSFYGQGKPIELTGFADLEYPSSYTSISRLISRDFQGKEDDASSPVLVQVPVYKTSYPPSRVGDYSRMHAPSSGAPTTSLQSSDNTGQGTSRQKDRPTVDANGRKVSVPMIPIKSNQADFGGVLRSGAFESHPAASDLGTNFGAALEFNLTPQSRNPSPFLSPLSSFQGQVVPIHTAGSSPQFPRYKGAVVEVSPVPSGRPKARGSYEPLYSQPLLHFAGEHGSRPPNAQRNTVHMPSVAMGDIIDDVEIVNKKNPEPHTPQPDDDDDDDDDDDEEDERYENPEKEYERSSEEVGRQSGKRFKEPSMESEFKPSTSFPFKEYDEKFGKYKAQTDDEDSEDKPYSSYKNYSSNDDDEEDESSSEDRAEYVKSSEPSQDSSSEEDESEEESHKHERHEGADDDSYQAAPKRSKYYGKDFEQEFEESYRRELPKLKYVHVKEVPEIDSYNNPKPPGRQRKDENRSRSDHGERGEPSRNHGERRSEISHRNREAPRTASYRDNVAYGTDMSTSTAPRVMYEELIYGYKNPETGRHAEHARTEAIARGKSPKGEESYLRVAGYHGFKSPKIGGALAYVKNDPCLYLRAGKSGKALPEETLPGPSSVGQSSDPRDGASFYGANAVNGQARSLANAEILCGLAGLRL